jgi:hypothetical protein
MSHFQVYYNELVLKENEAINKEKQYILEDDVKQYLFSLLEDYMSYEDNTPYKKQYENVVRTLSRQLRRYGVPRQASRQTTKAYCSSIYNQTNTD